MAWCPVCRAEYPDGSSRCAGCGSELVETSSSDLVLGGGSAENADGAGWPVVDGVPEEAAFLITLDPGMGAEITLSVLRSFGIPFVRRYPLAGRLVKVLIGDSMAGTDIFVPRGLLEHVRELLEAPPEFDGEDFPEE